MKFQLPWVSRDLENHHFPDFLEIVKKKITMQILEGPPENVYIYISNMYKTCPHVDFGGSPGKCKNKNVKNV